MANKKYVNDSMQNSTFQVNSHKPMDDRLVIRLRENLMQPETWQLTSNGDVMLYSGIIVNVIDDTDANNGLYSLKNWTKYDKQSWDETDDLTYDADGWKKVVGDSSDIEVVEIIKSGNNVACNTSSLDFYNMKINGRRPLFYVRDSDDVDLVGPLSSTDISFCEAEDGVLNMDLCLEGPSATADYFHRFEILFADTASSSAQVTITYSLVPYVASVPTLRTMNHEQLTDSTLGDINIHDGYYFPNAAQDADGNWYGAVVIGDQVWMAENYRCTKLPNGTQIVNASASVNNGAKLFSTSTPYYYWFNDSEAAVAEQGLLYNVSAFMNGETNSTANPSNVQGIAPAGWHIPSNAEFIQLTDYVSKQTRFLAKKETFQGVEYDDIVTLSLHSQDLLTSADIATLNSSESNSINATGFNVKLVEEFYLTTDENGSNVSDSEFSSGIEFRFNHVGGNIAKANAYITGSSSISLHDDHTEYVDDGPNTAGAWIRCVSDLSPVQFRNWYVETYGTMQHHLNENIIVNQNYDLYRCVMSYGAWNDVMGSEQYPAGTQLIEFTMPTNPYITLNHTDKPNRNPIIISKFNATNGQYEPLPPQQQSFVGLNHLITDAATDDHGAYQFELLPDMVNPVYHVFDIQHGLYAVWHKNGDAEMGNVQTIYQGILIGVTTSIGNDTTEIAFMLKIYKNSIQQ